MNLNRISSWSIRQPIPTLIFFLVITIAGLMSFSKLRINNFPDVTFPVVTVMVAQPGAAPAEIESQVARIVEDSVSGIGSVRHIYTTLGDGYASVAIEFQLGVDLDRATNDVRNAVASVRSDLPADVQDPVVQRMDSTGGAVLNYVVRGPGMSPEELSWFVDNTVAKQLLSIKGVASVGRDGGVDREIRVQVDPARLAAQGITASEISQQLRGFNINLPGGRVDLAGGEQAIRTLGSARSVDELRETRITLNNGRTIRLGDVADVTDGWTEPRGRARLNGEEVVGFNVNRTITSGEVGMATAVRKAIAELDEARTDITIEEVTTSVDAVMESYIASIEALLLGAVLAVLVVFVFLRDWRATFVAAMAMPLSLIPTFFVMEIFNQSFNVVTLLALSLTVGILVDDAIVEIENIVRHIRDGKKPYAASIEAADEIGLAVVATTATIIAVFAPVGFMPGVVGQFFVSFAIAACVSVFFSLVVARTITPLMGAYLLKADQGKDHGDPFWMTGYLSALAWGLKHKGLVLLFGILFFVGSIFIATRLPADFIPAGDVSRSVMSVELAPGSTLEDTDAVTKAISKELEARPEVKSVYSSIGSMTMIQGPGGGALGASVRRATLTVNLVPRYNRKLSQQEFELAFGETLKKYPGVRARFGADGGNGGGLAITLLSDDAEALQASAQEVERQMRALPTLRNVFSSANLVRPEILITPKADVAAELGVSALAISQVARVATVGDVDQSLAKYNLSDRQVPIRVMLAESSRKDLATLQTLQVPTKFGTSVPLATVADIRFGSGPITIERQERQRKVSIQGELNGVALGEALEQVHNLPAMKALPKSVKEVPAGDVEAQMEMGVGFMTAITTGIILMYVVLVLLFKSFSHPITILTALPMSFGGAFLLLLITGKSMSMPALIGIIMLTGIAAKNSILLVDYAIEAMKKGMNRYDALIDAAHKRARPIIMTTVAMGAGMLPIAMGMGADVSFRSPMAIAVIGGLITSTLLSLLFVPVSYALVDMASNFVGKRFQRFANPDGKAEDEAALRAEEP